MRKLYVALTFMMLMFVACLAFGQEAKVAQPEAKRPEPTLTVEQTKTLDLAVARIENYDLKIKLLEQERDIVRGAAQQFLNTLKVEGYNLTRTPDGKWAYEKVKK